jgi:competence protein ComEC
MANGALAAVGPRLLYCGGKEPLFLAAIAFASGIVAANFVWRSPFVWLLVFSVSSIGAVLLLKRNPQLACPCILVAISGLGAFYLQAFDAAQSAPPNLQAFATGEGETTVIGHVIREGLVRDSPFGGKQESVDIETDELSTADRTSHARIGIRLTIFSKQSEEATAEASGADSPVRVYTYGERLRFPAKLRLPRNYRNPGALDLVGYLASQGIRLTGSARASEAEVLPGFEGNRIGLWRSRARRSILAHIQQLWPGDRGELLQAMLIGGRAFFGREIKAEFQRTGTYHILVVSGINVGILAFALFWALRKLPFGEPAATVLTILLSWGYAFVADLGAPIVRATITLSIYLLTRLLFRDRAGLNALGIAALGILVVNPRTLFEASFQLTFLSVIAVAGIAVPVLRRTIYPLQTALRNLDAPMADFSLPTRAAQFRSDVLLVRRELAAVVGDRCASFLVVRTAAFLLGAAELVIGSIIIQLALTLPMAWYFHRVTTLSLPANALVIPLAGVLMPAAVLAVALSYISGWLAFVPALVTAYSLDLLTGTVRVIGRFRLSDVRLPAPSPVMCIVCACGFGVALLLVRRRPVLITAGLGVLAISGAQVYWRLQPLMSARATRCSSSHPKASRCCWIQGAQVRPRVRTSMLVRRSYRHICGRADFGVSTQLPCRTPIPIIWAECAASLPTSALASFGTALTRRLATSASSRRWLTRTELCCSNAMRASSSVLEEHRFGCSIRRLTGAAAIPHRTTSPWFCGCNTAGRRRCS